MGALPFSPGLVAVAGSRSLPPEASAVVSTVAGELVTSGCGGGLRRRLCCAWFCRPLQRQLSGYRLDNPVT